MHPINEQDKDSLVLMIAGLFMSLYGHLTKHTGFVLGGFIFFYMGVMLLKPLPKPKENPITPIGDSCAGGANESEDVQPGGSRCDTGHGHAYSRCYDNDLPRRDD